VDRPGQTDPGHQPDEPGCVAELGRQYRPDERPGAGNGREVMTEQDQTMGRVVVVSVVGRRRAGVVQRHDPGGDERALVPVGDDEDAEDR
jgi:hypothetical protein